MLFVVAEVSVLGTQAGFPRLNPESADLAGAPLSLHLSTTVPFNVTERAKRCPSADDDTSGDIATG